MGTTMKVVLGLVAVVLVARLVATVLELLTLPGRAAAVASIAVLTLAVVAVALYAVARFRVRRTTKTGRRAP